MSDLQCPAQVWLIAADFLAPGANMPAPCAGVFVAFSVATDPRQLAGAAALASAASCPLETLGSALDAESLAQAIDELADLHRGETFLVLATRTVIGELTGRASDATQPVVVAIDSSGWRVL